MAKPVMCIPASRSETGIIKVAPAPQEVGRWEDVLADALRVTYLEPLYGRVRWNHLYEVRDSLGYRCIYAVE